MHNTSKENYPGSVTPFDTWPGNEVGLFYRAPQAYMGHIQTKKNITTDNKVIRDNNKAIT